MEAEEAEAEITSGRTIFVSLHNGEPMAENMLRDAQLVIEAALDLQYRNPEELPIIIDEWDESRGRLTIIPGGHASQANGDRLIRIINERLRVHNTRLRAQWDHELPRVARLTVKFSSGGDAQELIEGELVGITRLNGWPTSGPNSVRGQVRYLHTIRSDEENPTHRLVRFEASPAVVALIQGRDGLIHIGRGRGTVQSGKKAVKRDSSVNYYLQK